MSWFGSSSSQMTPLDNKILEATSESIPNGELDLYVALEVTDMIRSKTLPAKQCMRSLKKRLTTVYQNPNLLKSTLKLVDLSVKNGGYHFLVELTSKEFIDYLIDYIFKVHYNTKDSKIAYDSAKLDVGEFILSLVQDWKVYFEGQLQLNYVEKCYNQLLNQGYEFPLREDKLNSKFVDSEAPPDWVDNDECMICYNPFSLINRKHHCRSCGGVFCMTHSSHNIPLVSLGIMEPVRVCDNCYEKRKYQKSGTKSNQSPSGNVDGSTIDEDEQLRRALELSLHDSSIQSSRPNDLPPVPVTSVPASKDSVQDDEDEEMKRAIEASLKEFKDQEERFKQQENNQYAQQNLSSGNSDSQSDFYSNILPTNTFTPSHQSNSLQPSYIHQPNQVQPEVIVSPKTEDLTQQEEEQINLFITLIKQIRNDTNKQANILYHSNLNELHSKVIKLKPKLNKALRLSIERYESFLELHNKITTITRLYDQFLESKLSMVYGNHNISSLVGQQEYIQRNDTQTMPPFPNMFQQNPGYSNPDHLERQQSEYSSHMSPQNTVSSVNIIEPQHTSYYENYNTNYDKTHIMNNQELAYPTNPGQSQNSNFYPSEVPDDSSISPRNSTSNPMNRFNYPSQPELDGPSEPQLPYSSNEVVYNGDISQYPSDLVYPRNSYSSINEENEAENKYPTIEKFDDEYKKNTESESLPTMPDAPKWESNKSKITQSKTSLVSEAEPLIEL